MNIANSDSSVNDQSEIAIDQKREDRREWIKLAPWFGTVKSYVDDRNRYVREREMAANVAVPRRRGWVAGNDRLLALVAVLDALQDWQGNDKSGARRSVPAGIEFISDLLISVGFGDGIKTETLDSYVSEFLDYLRRSNQIAIVREARRVSRRRDDANSREYLTYFGREPATNEPHAEPRCWRQKERIEPRSNKEAHEVVTSKPHEHANAWEKWESDRKTPTKPVRDMVDFVDHIESGRDGRPHVAAMRQLNGIDYTPSRLVDRNPSKGGRKMSKENRRGYLPGAHWKDVLSGRPVTPSDKKKNTPRVAIYECRDCHRPCHISRRSRTMRCESCGGVLDPRERPREGNSEI